MDNGGPARSRDEHYRNAERNIRYKRDRFFGTEPITTIPLRTVPNGPPVSPPLPPPPTTTADRSLPPPPPLSARRTVLVDRCRSRSITVVTLSRRINTHTYTLNVRYTRGQKMIAFKRFSVFPSSPQPNAFPYASYRLPIVIITFFFVVSTRRTIIIIII